MQTRAGAAAEAFADSAIADKILQKQQAFLQRASISDVAAVVDRLAVKGQDALRRAAAAVASARATNGSHGGSQRVSCCAGVDSQGFAVVQNHQLD
ncbi:TPA: hypothetical protein ACH3X1_008888 [Trebouxia sp. C0004]